jgi:membrane dipeptidase
MRLHLLVFALLLLGGAPQAKAQGTDSDLAASARLIAQKALIVDTHIDVPERLREEGWVDVTAATKGGDFDYERARQGGLDVPFMSIYIPSEFEAKGGSFALANHLIDSVEARAKRNGPGLRA